ncbi:DUF6468 domain-containing protein [Komagataeibacter sp. FNDCR2]|uniref:DUF6468 domain-containing protein n=1 Tax=Komagataeibacter sp. FNDCR2 TaxID=2878682 RepID=UPI001E2D64BF|nr:DUF6468 domain-containing protein [Komagataeibacter sp. FNDCR2]
MLIQIQMIIEVVLSFFLFLGIIYSFYLGRVLSNLRRDRASLLELVAKLESSVRSAEDGVEKLRVAGEVSGRPLSKMIEQAKITGTELGSMAGQADTTADRLQLLITQMLSQEKQLKILIEQAEDVRMEMIEKAASIGYSANGVEEAPEVSLQDRADQATGDPLPGDNSHDDMRTPDQDPKGNRADIPVPQADSDSPGKKTMFTDTINVPAPASVTRTRPYMRALGKTFLADPADLVTVWSDQPR